MVEGDRERYNEVVWVWVDERSFSGGEQYDQAGDQVNSRLPTECDSFSEMTAHLPAPASLGVLPCAPTLTALLPGAAPQVVSKSWAGASCSEASLRGLLVSLHQIFVLLHGPMARTLEQVRGVVCAPYALCFMVA